MPLVSTPAAASWAVTLSIVLSAARPTARGMTDLFLLRLSAFLTRATFLRALISPARARVSSSTSDSSPASSAAAAASDCC
eukprot:13539-Heterococcus_DN1.PRE.3